ncbi:MAG TPA: arginine repressor [Tepidiformaceae bacterium]|jgi:transcriptional regulator of arginine metabolism|nr:arginine repressor [Candidatus Eisenbacteria bacterium]HEX6031510.1 arginine repressor [Tepidiformaceae bacterium]
MNIYAPRRGGPQDPDATARRKAIVEVVQAVAIRSQQELADHLKHRGFQATQATLSRDLRNLGIGKVPGSEGVRYVLPKAPHEVMDESQRRLEVGAFIQSVELIGNLALVRTPPGNAHGVGRALDSLGWPEIAGTVAGDDTLLVVTRTATAARSFRRKLSDITRRAYR